ncbi:MAG: LysR family transcriptional regulator [Bryobacterales bacterium]|nr:LysR family transcriptional regulator [Bryobacterales bacterium]
MELYQLRYFAAVARAGSFTRAAESEGVTQPSLSEGIRRLEEELGTPLLERLGRTVRLTEAGERLLPHAQQVLREVAQVRRIGRAESGTQPGGKLVVGCIPTITPYLLAPHLADFLVRFPEVDLQLHEHLTARLLERLQDGEIQLAVLALPIKKPEIVVSEILREPLLLAVSKQHALARKPQARLQEIGGEDALLLREGHCFRQDVLSVCQKARVILSGRFESDHLTTIISLAAGGFGIGIIPAMAASHAADCALLPLHPPGERRIGYARVRNHHATPAERAFLTWLRGLATRRKETQ